MRVLVVAPTRREAAACGVPAEVIGVGRRAAEAAETVLRRDPPDALLIAGVCGGLDPSLAPGGVILARRATAPDRPELTPSAAPFAAARHTLQARGLPFVSSILLTVDRPAGSRDEKLTLWNSHGAAGVDMETYAVAEAAERLSVRWLALRAVLDPAGAGLPRDLRDWQEEAGEREMIGRIARRPLDWPAYARLVLGLRRALAALRQAVPPVVEAVSSASADDREVREIPLITLR
jgi:adenosylhomocysteine nucleosidase